MSITQINYADLCCTGLTHFHKLTTPTFHIGNYHVVAI